MIEKKFYWLKLMDDFFLDKYIKKLRAVAGGDTFVIIYLKLQLLSLQNGGLLKFDGVEETFADELALELDEHIEDVKITLAYLMLHKLIIASDIPNEYNLPKTQQLIGCETQAADRMRKHREKNKKLEIRHDDNVNSNITNNVTEPIPYSTILDYLNAKTKKNFKPSGKKNKELIKARWNEGYQLEDFKKVIDIKVIEWLNDTKMDAFLRPETLFSNKFESYLNQKDIEAKTSGKSPIKEKQDKDPNRDRYGMWI